MLRVVTDDDAHAESRWAIDEICAEGARRMLAAALEAEVDGYVEGLAGSWTSAGHRLVVRNGHAEARTITTGAGAIKVQAPVNDRRTNPETGERSRRSGWHRGAGDRGSSTYTGSLHAQGGSPRRHLTRTRAGPAGPPIPGDATRPR